MTPQKANISFTRPELQLGNSNPYHSFKENKMQRPSLFTRLQTGLTGLIKFFNRLEENPVEVKTESPKHETPPDRYAELTAAGWTVKLRHLRYFPEWKNANGEAAYFTKGSFRNGFKNDLKGTEPDKSYLSSVYRKFVSDFGGITKCQLISPDGKCYDGVAVCSMTDQFSRREGRSWAIDRAYQKYLAEQPKKEENEE